MAKIGMLIAADAFIGNMDRLRELKANIGNIMLTENGIGSIDTETWLPEINFKNIDTAMQHPRSETALKDAQLEKTLDGLVLVIETILAKVTTCDAVGIWKAKYDRGKALEGLFAGVKFVRSQVVEVLGNRKERGKLKKELKTSHFGESTQENKMRWNTLRTKQYYWKLARDHPEMPKEELEQKVLAYAQYRAKRKRAKLKFLVKKPR
jgi:hypothetical protein